MNSLIILVLSVVIAVQAGFDEEQKQKIQSYHKECQAKSGVTAELLQKARKGEYVDDPKLKQHLFCFVKKAGFMNKDGNFQPEVIKTKIGPQLKTPSTIDALIKQCAIKKATQEDSAFEALKCFYNNSDPHTALA